jgi:hypothetical protein
MQNAPPRLLATRLVWATSFVLLACGSTADMPPDDTGVNPVTGGGVSTGGSGTAGMGADMGVGADGGTVGNGGGWPTGGTGSGTGGTSSGTGGSGGDPGPRIFDAGSDPNRNRVQAGAVCDRLAIIQCAGERYCCDDPGRSFEQCHLAQVSACRDEAHLDQITLNSITGYSVSHAETAFSEFERRASECDPSIAEWAASTGGMRSITQGTRSIGSDCSLSVFGSEAANGAQLVSCANPAQAACLVESSLYAASCVMRGQAGTKCFTDLNCVDGFFCNNPNLATSGDTCQTRKSNGASCSAQNECQSLTCRGGTCMEPTVQTAYCLAR